MKAMLRRARRMGAFVALASAATLLTRAQAPRRVTIDDLIALTILNDVKISRGPSRDTTSYKSMLDSQASG